MDAELGTVTLLSVDQVGSTDQLRALGDTAGREVRSRLLDHLCDIVAEHRGTIIETTGDGFNAHFPSAGQALTTAQACMALVDRQSRTVDEISRCQLRAGVHTGDLLVDDTGRVHGMAIVIACRLGAAARTSEILVSSLTRTLATTRSEFRFGAERAYELKGVGTAVSASPLEWESATPDLPGLTPLDERFPFVGRADEAQVIQMALDESRRGERQIVTIAGEPGVGKTRLAAEALRQASAAGSVTGVGVCDPDLPQAYQAVLDAVGAAFAQLPGPVARPVLARHPTLVRLLGGDAPVSAEPGTVAERHRLFGDLVAALREAASSAPVVLLLDDIQWATVDTIAMVRHLARNVEGRVAVLCTYRSSDLTSDHPTYALLADLHRLPGVRQLHLAGLRPDEVVELASGAAGHALGESELALARRIHDESNGSPFFATELIRHLVDTGGVLNVGGRWVVAGDVAGSLPPSVRDVVLRRVALLDPDTQHLLRTAAVIGQSFPFRLLVRVADVADLPALAGVEAALAAGLIDEVSAGRFQFRHRLTRLSLYEDISATRRALLHRRVGEELEASGGSDHVEELAYHWSEATGLADAMRVAGYCRLAGDRARARQAPLDACRLYERALVTFELAGEVDPAERCDVLLSLGQVQRALGDGSARMRLEEAAELARQLGDQNRLARAVQAMLRAASFFTEAAAADQGLIDLIDEALVTSEGGARARLLAARAAERHWVEHPDVLDAVTVEALKLARSSSDDRVVAEVLLARCVALGGPAHTRLRVAMADEALDLGHRLGDVDLEASALLTRVCALYELGDARALDELPDLYRLADLVTDRFTVWLIRLLEAARVIMVDGAAGEEAALLAYRVAEASNQPDAFAGLAVQLADAFWHSGRLDEVVDEYGQVARERPVVALRSGYARVLLELGRRDEAAAELAALAEGGLDAPRDMTWLGYLADLAVVVSELGSDQQRELVYRWLAPYAGRFTWSVWFLVCEGSVDRLLGLLAASLGRIDDARGHLGRALQLEERFGHPVWAERCQAVLARLEADEATPSGL